MNTDSTRASSVSAGSVPAGSVPAGSVPTEKTLPFYEKPASTLNGQLTFPLIKEGQEAFDPTTSFDLSRAIDLAGKAPELHGTIDQVETFIKEACARRRHPFPNDSHVNIFMTGFEFYYKWSHAALECFLVDAGIPRKPAQWIVWDIECALHVNKHGHNPEMLQDLSQLPFRSLLSMPSTLELDSPSYEYETSQLPPGSVRATGEIEKRWL